MSMSDHLLCLNDVVTGVESQMTVLLELNLVEEYVATLEFRRSSLIQ